MAHTEFILKTNAVLEEHAAADLKKHLHAMFTLLRPLNEKIEVTYNILPTTINIEIGCDEFCESPLTSYDHFFIVYCNHPRYNLGHKNAQDPYKIDEDTNECEFIKDVVAILPLYLYDHSGITISTGRFSDSWDSGQIGWIYCTKESMAEMGIAPETPVETLQLWMQTFIDKEYDAYLRGYCYYCKITDENDDEIDSYYGYIGENLEDTGILDTTPTELKDAVIAAWEKRYDNK